MRTNFKTGSYRARIPHKAQERKIKWVREIIKNILDAAGKKGSAGLNLQYNKTERSRKVTDKSGRNSQKGDPSSNQK